MTEPRRRSRPSRRSGVARIRRTGTEWRTASAVAGRARTGARLRRETGLGHRGRALALKLAAAAEQMRYNGRESNEVSVRFTADGVNIPDDLLWAHDEGRVVLFCGAGVSQAKARLPDFNGLTKRVLDELGAEPADSARTLYESLNGVDGLAISDQVFQRLRRTFTEADIGAKVAKCLVTPDDVDLTAHKALLRLAKLKTGETRIVTTNFDRLFEKCSSRLASVTRSSLPHLQFNEADWGIVHLHGCVLPDYSGPTRDGFVLSSAEFGNAYLALGWARDFVKQILERYVAVFVGYSADDPPIRYLLEGLQQSKASNNRAYAFQSASKEQAVIAWEEKGVEALVYPTEPGDGHRRLWESLDAWGKRATDPPSWRKRVFDMARKGPRKLAPHERGMMAHIVSSASGAQALAQHEPVIPAEWLCVFDPLIRFGEPGSITGRYSGGPVIDPFDHYRLDSDQPPRVKGEEIQKTERKPKDAWSAFDGLPADYRELGPNQLSSVRGYFAHNTPYLPRRLGSIASWIVAVADQPAAVWWAGQQGFLHHEVLDRLRGDRVAKTSKSTQLVVADAWRTIAEYHDLHAADRDRAYELRLRAGKAGWHESLAREYARNFSPKLKLNAMWRSPIPPSASRKLRRSDLVRVDVEYSEGVRTIEVPDDYLTSLIGKLRGALELAEDLERRYSAYIEIASIEPDDDDDGESNFSRHYKLSGHVILFACLLRRLASINPEAARNEIVAWPRTSHVFERLRIWALGNLDIMSAQAFVGELLILSDEGFWPFRGERDLLLGLSRRWSAFDPQARRRLEWRIRRGPPKSKGKDESQRSAHWRLSRLNWLNARGCALSFDLDAENANLRALAPLWKPEYAARAAESRDGKSGWVRTETDFSGVEGLAPGEVIPHIQKLQRHPAGEFVSYDPFQGLSQHRPHTALAALTASLAEGTFDPSFWETFLRVDIRKDDEPDLMHTIARTLAALPTEKLGGIGRAAASWFEAAGKALWVSHPQEFDSLWNKFIDVLNADEDVNKSSLVRGDRAVDWATEAINSPAGDLAELVILISPEKPEDKNAGFPKTWLARVEQLLSLPGDSRRYALVILGFQLVWLFARDPGWTDSHIVAVLGDSSVQEADKEAIWSGVFWRAHVPQLALYTKLKPQLMQMVRADSPQRSRHTEILAGFLLAGWSPSKDGERVVSSEEMRALLLEGDEAFRLQILYSLDRWSDGDGPWASHAVQFLREAWPKQKSIRTPRISARLCELALSQKQNFPEMAEVVSSLVTKVGDDRIFIPELRKTDETIAGQHPVEMLGLLYAVLPENRTHWPWGADAALNALAEKMPSIRSDPRFIELQGRQS